jgi:hypothetical protein
MSKLFPIGNKFEVYSKIDINEYKMVVRIVAPPFSYGNSHNMNLLVSLFENFNGLSVIKQILSEYIGSIPFKILYALLKVSKWV